MRSVDFFKEDQINLKLPVKRATALVRSYRKSINPPYETKDWITIAATLFVLIAIPLTALVAQQRFSFVSEAARADGAYQIPINMTGSLQNAAWSPGRSEILFTRWRNGYNRGAADLFVVNLGTNATRTLVSEGSANVNLPGAVWNQVTGKITFSSARDPHDEIFIISENGSPGNEVRVTNRSDKQAYEPSLSPDGQWVVFESHQIDVEGNGIITKYRVDGTGSYQALSPSNEDCRQPNWSPVGNLILYQKLVSGSWDIWVMNTDGTGHRKVTSGSGDKTDASFSPDGQWIVYSSDEGGVNYANIFIIPVSGGSSTRVTNYNGYDGAPSWSADGSKIAFESYQGDPDGSSGTTLWIIDSPLGGDSIPPTVSITSPANGATVSGTVNITASASDNVGVTKVEFYVDGALKSTDTTSPYSYSWSTTTVSNGSHTLVAKAYDAAGNVGNSTTISVTVNNVSAPTVDIKANGSNGPITINYNTAATLSWTSTNTTTCTASGGWSGSKGTSGSESTGNLTSNKTYTLTCTGPGGTAADSVVVNVSAPPTKPGDINSDGVVNIFDLSILLSNWGTTGGAADINKDGRVDIFDLSILLTNWTG